MSRKGYGQIASRNDWLRVMNGVPPERRRLYLEIRDSLHVMFTSPIKETEAGLSMMVGKLFYPGASTVAGIKYEWCLARMPFYVEWKISKGDGQLYGVIYQLASEFIQQDWEVSRSQIEQRNRSRAFAINEELENYVLKCRQTVPNPSILGLPALRVLCKQQQEKRKQTWQDKIVKFLASRGFGKQNIEHVNVAISQMLADMFNNGNTYSKYLALTWEDYENDEDLKRAGEKAIRKKTRKQKKVTAQPMPASAGNMSIVPNMNEVEDVSLDNSEDNITSSNKKGKQRAEAQTFAGVYGSEVNLLSEQIASGEWDASNPNSQQFSTNKTNKEEKEAKGNPDNKDLLKDCGTIRNHVFNLPNASAIELGSPPNSGDTPPYPTTASAVICSDSRGSSLATSSLGSDHTRLLQTSHNNNILSKTQSLDNSSTEHTCQALETPTSAQLLYSEEQTATKMPRSGPRIPRRERAIAKSKLASQQVDQTVQTEIEESSQIAASFSTPSLELQSVPSTSPSFSTPLPELQSVPNTSPSFSTPLPELQSVPNTSPSFSTPFPELQSVPSTSPSLGESSQIASSFSTPFPELQIVPNTSPSSESDAAKSKRRDSIEAIRRGLERRQSTSDGPAITQSQTSFVSDTNAPKTNTRPSVSSLALLPGPLRDVIGNEASRRSTALKAHNKSSGSSLRHLVAIPDVKHLFKQDKQTKKTDSETDSVVSEASSSTQSHIMSKDNGAQSSSKSVHRGSELRGEAREFVPITLASHQSRLPSSTASPEVAPISSVPMSMSTSATTNTSIGANAHKLLEFGQSVVAREGLDVTFNLPDPPYTIKNAPMIYPSEATIRDLKEKLFKRPRSSSTSKAPSTTVSDFNVEFAEQAVEEGHLLETWPDFTDNHLTLHTPWRYANHNETAESIILNHGHENNYFRPDSYFTRIREIASTNNLIPIEVPAVLMKTRSGCPIATGQFDTENNVWKIFAPSSAPGADIRNLDDHPDYLEPGKLLEIQGLEMFCYTVHVATRFVHTCHRKECTNQVRDDDSPGAIVCRGCGPLCSVRYCSVKCVFEDLSNHWTECGTSKFYPPYNLCVDPDISFPAKFKELFPMIKDVSGWDSMQRRRIHWLSKYLDGEYGLYPDETQSALQIKLPPSVDNELGRRVQRLINCALLDRRNRTLISYLYILIRDALCKQIKAAIGELSVVLRYQFIHEWNFEWEGPEGYELLDTVEPCECMWIGKSNFSSCKESCKGERVLGEKFSETGLKPFVELLEKEHWILRAWYTNHPKTRDWRKRIYGNGFRGVKPKKFKNLLPVLGVGYDGHISKNLVVGDWRPRLTLEAPPPPFLRAHDRSYEQDPASYFWKEPEA